MIGLRRLHDAIKKRPETSGDGGATVLMRYTLCPLTIQQFQRAATLLCACEVLRLEASGRLGRQPFTVELWVSGGATPNHIDHKPDPQDGCESGHYSVRGERCKGSGLTSTSRRGRA